MTHLKVLVIDDERPALDELTFLLRREPRVGEVLACDSATEALRVLETTGTHIAGFVLTKAAAQPSA